MAGVGPIRKHDVSSSGAVDVPKLTQQSAETAEKVAQVAQPPKVREPGLRERQVTPLMEATKLAREIQNTWDSLEIHDLAEKIVSLEDKVSRITEMTPEAEKIKRLAEHLHFQFVHPVSKELEEARDGTEMPFSFVQSIKEIAGKMMHTNSLDSFKELTPIQQREIVHYARAGG